MSVLIKGLEMPETEYMDVRIFWDGTAAIATGAKPYYREFEVAEVHTPHGRLIDHKKLEKDLGERWNVNDDQDFCNKEVWHALEEAPTVI